MSTPFAPLQTLTFTVKAMPRRVAQRKTIERLMGMERRVQQGRDQLRLRRERVENRTEIRAGRPWTDRKTVTQFARVSLGASFTIFVTQQLLPDLRSVEKLLDASPAKSSDKPAAKPATKAPAKRS